MRFFLLFLITFFPSFDLHAQTSTRDDSSKLYTVDQLISDFHYFRGILERAHPSLYRYISKDSLDHYFDKGFLKLNHPMTEMQYWQILQYITAKIGSGHTKTLPCEKTLKRFSEHQYPEMPFNVYVNKNKLFVKDHNRRRDTSFSDGYEIISINGESKQQLFDHIRTLVSGDGITKSYKNYCLERGDFNMIYAMIHPNTKDYSLIFKNLKGNYKTVKLKPIIENFNDKIVDSNKSSDTLLNNAYSAPLKDNTLPDSALHKVFYSEDLSVAVLSIKAFTYTDYLSFHKELFERLDEKKIKDLIIDVRNNPGGQDFISIDLLKYLINTDFYYTQSDEGVVDISNFKSLITGNSSDTIAYSLIAHKPYSIKMSANALQTSYKHRFNGRIYLLINGGTFSASSLFSVALKTEGNCLVYGSETGGGEAGCDGGSIIKVRLPQTSLQLMLPLLWTYSVSKQNNNGKGLIPDTILPHTWLDLDYIFLKLAIEQSKDSPK